MNTVTTDQFRQLYIEAPVERRRKIRRAYQLWRDNPSHPSLRFKKVHATLPIYSARVETYELLLLQPAWHRRLRVQRPSPELRYLCRQARQPR